MTDTPKTPADWRAKIDTLQTRLAEAEDGFEKAKAKAARAVLEDGEDGSREIALWRDRIDAVKTALAEAQRHLKDAEQAVTEKARKAALTRANEAAKKRFEAAQDFDAAMAEAERAYGRFLDANLEWRRHMLDAGQKPYSTEKLNAGEAVRGAVTEAAFTLSGALSCRPMHRDLRLPLASFVLKQTAFRPRTKSPNKKAAA